MLDKTSYRTHAVPGAETQVNGKKVTGYVKRTKVKVPAMEPTV